MIDQNDVPALTGFISGDFNASIFQAFCAFMFGFYMVALRVHLDTIIPGIIIHWLWYCFALLTHFPEDTMVCVLIGLVLFYYGYGYLETICLQDKIIHRIQERLSAFSW